MRRLTLLYVTAGAPFGPNETFVLEEIRALLALGHEVRIVPLWPRGPVVHAAGTALLARTVAQPLLGAVILVGALRELVRAPLRALAAAALLLTWHPRALVINLAVYAKALWLAGYARALGADHVHAHWATAPATLAMAAAHVAGIPWSFTAHRYDLVANPLLARKSAHAAFVRVISAHGRALAVAGGADPNKLALLPMGVRVLPGAELRALPVRRVLRVLVPARLHPVKGHDVLMAAAAQLVGRVTFLLAGDGPLRRELGRGLAVAGPANVHLLGAVPHERLLALLRSRAVDVVVLSSRIEGIPVALMEAMAHGLPVIAPAVGGTPELLADGAGVLVPAGDPAALAAAIAQLAQDPDARRRLGVAGRARVTQHFCLDDVAARLARRFASPSTSLVVRPIRAAPVGAPAGARRHP